MTNRMTKRRTLLSLLMAFGVFAFVSKVEAGHKGAKYHSYHGYHGSWDSDEAHGNLFLDYSDELGLSEKQVAELNEIRNKTREKRMELKHEIYKLKADLGKKAHGEKPNRKELKKIAEKIGKVKGELINLATTSILDAKDVLTKDQKGKLSSMFSDSDDDVCPKCEGKGCKHCPKAKMCPKCKGDGCVACMKKSQNDKKKSD